MTAILKQFQATPPPASVKAVEKICVTFGGAHPYYQCLAAGGNTFPELRDNIQGYVAAAAVNYTQGSGSLPSNTVANPKGELKAITTRSGLVLDGPAIPTPPPFINPGVDERVEETLTDQDLSEYTIKVPPPAVQKYKPPSQRDYVVHQRDPLHPNIPYPSRMLKRKYEDFLEDLFSTNQPSGNPTFSSHPELTSPEVKDDIFNPEGGIVLPEKFLDLDSTKDLHPPPHVNPLSGSTTYSSSSNQLLEEFADELALITFPLEYDDDLQFDIDNLADLDNNLVDSMPEMFLDEHALDYSFPLIFDEYDDDFFEVKFDTENVYNDPFDSKGEKIKESKLLIDELDLPCDFLLSEYDSFLYEDFSRVDALSSTNNEDKVFKPCIFIQENPFKIINPIVQGKKLATSNASLVIEDCDPPLYELSFFKEVLRSKMLLLFSSKNKEKVFKPGIHNSKKVHSSLIPELSHQGYKVFKIN
nr:hypothetical protein [Tanacetum cinerariifolium]